MDRIVSRINDINNNASDVVVTSSSLESYGLTDITLRSYQEKGVEWLCQRFHQGHGCILGDEMGLGKTCQTISFLLYLRGSGESGGPHMIISPLSVVPNWQGELARFAPKMNVICYVGDKDTRERLRSKIKKNIDDVNVVITTYELCLKDEVFLRRYRWHTLIVDEAHRLKNRESLLHQVLKEFDITHHVLLTGTPVQNNLTELYALLSFVAPSIFKGKYLEKFVEKYNDVEAGSEEASELHNLLQPFLLRRVKNEVVLDLPQRTEVVLYHGMSALQKKYYKAILTKDLDVFNKANPSKKTRLLNIVMQLRKCVNHPYLFDGVEPEPFQIGEHIVEASGKLVLIDQLLGHLQPRGHKVLLFSQMTHMLDILQDYLTFRGYSYERLDGSVRGEERYLAVQGFNQTDDTFIFLLSTRAGGVGLNLVAADTVIFVDSDFNPQNDLQAAARAHRIGQTRPVKVLRLVGRSSVEEVILRRAEAKLKLTNTVIEGGQFSLGASKEGSAAGDNSNELQDILKFGVDKLFADEDSTIENVDFDTILGPTVDGEWQPEEENKQAQASLMMASMDVDNMEEGGTLYTFEGTDYAQEPSAADKKAFDDLVTAQKAVLEEESTEPQALRRTKTARVLEMLPDLPKRERKKLTPEQLEERKKKRAETLARKAEEAQAEEARRAAIQKRRLAKLWEENGYESVNLPLPDDSEDEDEEEPVAMATDEDGSGDSRAIRYVVGDVTHPAYADGKDAIVVHCVDDSGHWGYGGLFSALARRSTVPEEAYTLAGKMKDLSLGDSHLIPVDDLQSREQGNDYVCLIIAQHRDRKNNLSGIKLEALNEGLQRLYKAALKHRASVHLPRIGHNTPGFNWYGTERLIRKHLASRGIPTYIYYYARKKVAAKRRRSSSSDDDGKTKKLPLAKKPSVHRRLSSSSDHKSRSQSPSVATAKRSPSPDENKRSDSPVASTSMHDISDSDTNHTPIKRQAEVDESETPVKKSLDMDESDAEPSESFLENTTIYLHNLPSDVKKKFTRSIISHDGDVHQTIEESTDYAIVDAAISEEDLRVLKSATADFLDEVTIVTLQWLDDSCQARRKKATKKYTRR